MSEARNPLQSVVIVGDGQVGVLAAIAMKRALPAATVTIIGVARADASFADFAPTGLPFTNMLHARLGLSEELLVAKAGASHRLLTRYFGWGGDGQHGALQYGEQADAAHAASFGRDWGGGSRNAASTAEHRSIAEALAAAGRFAPPLPDANGALPPVGYALRWNVPAYHALLVQAARSIGVEHIPAAGLEIEPDTAGGIAALNVTGGNSISADLYLDCSGAGAVLAGRLPGTVWQDWSAHLATRNVYVGTVGGPMLALEDRLSLTRAGWISEIAGRDGLQTTLGCSEGVSEDDAVATLGTAPVARIAVDPSRIEKSWQGNVIAIGDAAARFAPLGGLNLDLAHRQIDLLMEMLPGMPFIELERAELNRRSGLMMDGVRDILAMHYSAPNAPPTFASKPPDAVATQIDQFTRRGRLPFREESPLLAAETMALLRALGFSAGLAPQHSSRNEAENSMAERDFIARRDAALAQMPPYQQWVASIMQGAG